jgi:serine/threonine protein kinase
VQRRIGEGGMGVVYEAYDRERHQLVALKTLQHFSPTALYRFKQEFRTLAFVSHPNLVRLYELIATGNDRIFFTMELVDGTDFLSYVRRRDPPAEASGAHPAPPIARAAHATEPRGLKSRPEDSITMKLPSNAPPPPPPLTRGHRGRSPADFERLRPALAQLIEGVHALHAAGKLHRDIKPSNVRVTSEGRVVVLDFGVATELARVADENLDEHEIVGTARYMAPEQSTDGQPSPASDWYSVGVMLYQALVGHAPFVGDPMDVLAKKSLFDPTPPRDCAAGIPPDLDALCCDLLRRSPEARPSGPELLRRIRGGAARPSPAPAAPIGVPLVGRDAHLGALRDAFEATRGGRCVTVRVHGASGMGKSALVQRFLDELVENGEAVVLRGRAYERESVPYKAFDSVVDALSRYLRRLAEREATLPLPRDVWALARLFPVLRRVAAIDAAPEPAVEDLQYVRRRAFVALRELLTALAQRQPIVLYIDDLQWGDVDSAGLILEIVRQPYPPPLLLLASYQEEAAPSPFLREIKEKWPERAEARDIAVGPLEQEDARRLALTLLASTDAASLESAEAIARESGGSAFLVDELARSVAAKGRNEAIGAVTLERMLNDRLARVPEAARRLLEIVAVAARPLAVETAGASAAVREGLDDCIAALRTGRFVRTGLRDGREVIETIHDRIRAVLVAQLPAATLREHHRRLARILEGLPAVDPEALALHFLGAGETQSAARYAERAAAHAVTKLAFEQAARLYRLTLDIALETPGRSPSEVRRLRVRHAEALKLAGRATDAARAFLAAAAGAASLERIDLEREAAEQLITSGHIDEGIEVMRRVLAAVGMRISASPTSALFWLVVCRVWLWFRGYGFRERSPDEVNPEDRARIDVYHAVALGLSLVDAIYGAYMQSRHLLLALRAGDRMRVVRALTLESAHLASRGGPETPRERALSDAARKLGERTREPEARGYLDATRGFRFYLRGAWKAAREACDGGVVVPDDRTGWRSNVQLFTLWSLLSLGQVAEVTRRAPQLAADAMNRGDLYTAVNLRIGSVNLVWLAADDVDEARRQIAEGMANWSHRNFYLQHYRALIAGGNVELYAGEWARAHALITSRWRDLDRSLLLRVQLVRGEAIFLRGRCAIASIGVPGVSPSEARARIALAERCAARLEGEKMAWTAPLAHFVRAGVAHAKKQADAEQSHLRAAIEAADAADMSMHAAVARLRLGRLVGGDEGRDLLRYADDWMGAQGIQAPDRLARMLAPWG